jgi:hypothetical protein
MEAVCVSELLVPTYNSVLYLNSEAASCCVGTLRSLLGVKQPVLEHDQD